MGLIKIVKEARTIKYEFSESELKNLAGDITKLVKKHDRWEMVKSMVTKHLGSKIKDIQFDISKFSKQYRDKYTEKTVDCEVHYDYQTKEIRVYRADTMQQVGARTMTSDELQQEIFEEKPHEITAPVEDEDKGLLDEENIEEEVA